LGFGVSYFQRVGLLLCLNALAACGGGGGSGNVDKYVDVGGGTNTPDQPTKPKPPEYPTQGLGVRIVSNLPGTAGYSGPPSSSTDASIMGYSGTYEYVTPYRHGFVSDTITSETYGVTGRVSDAGDMPLTGTATYRGEAFAIVVDSSGTYRMTGGESEVSVDFLSQSADVTLDGFTSVDHATGNAASAPIDTIEITGMTITGNQMGGGTLSTLNGAAVVDVTGANTITDAQALFFGLAGEAPDEVAGTVLSQGDDGTVLGTFIAD